MFATDAHLHVRPRAVATGHGQFDEFAHAIFVQCHEGITRHDAFGLVLCHETPSVVSTEAIGGLRQVIGAEAEKLRVLGQFGSLKSCPWKFNHRTNAILKVHILLFLNSCRGLVDDLFDDFELTDRGHQRYHDFDHGKLLRRSGSTCFHCCTENGTRLHLADLRISNRQATATVSQHGIGFVQLGGTSTHTVHWHACSPRHVGQLGLRVGQELMQGRIKQTNRNRMTLHDLEEFGHIFPLHEQ
mmetsp:Transcript_19112/g.42232  ORF Transcript_19112/g.42232 Transcript_19112/m.42232 type:complete len:243 (-) Transcript_19112:1808-2536(-)